MINTLITILIPFNALFDMMLGVNRSAYYSMAAFLFNILLYTFLFFIFYKKMIKKIKVICWILFVIVILFNVTMFLILFLNFTIYGNITI